MELNKIYEETDKLFKAKQEELDSVVHIVSELKETIQGQRNTMRALESENVLMKEKLGKLKSAFEGVK